MIEMPDVNVLVALVDDLHIHHQVAIDWFTQATQTGWATCPLTISGVLRVISRPQPPRNLLIPEAASLLQTLIDANGEQHHFWQDDISILDETLFDLQPLQGYRQITDLHLLGIAHRHGGTFVTLDTGCTQTLLSVRNPDPHLLRILTP